MGWGKTTGAKPQPTSRPVVTAEDVEEPEPVAKEKPSDAAKAEAAWAQFRSKKGWVPDTVAMILYEFVRDRGLFGDLVTYAKRRK